MASSSHPAPLLRSDCLERDGCSVSTLSPPAFGDEKRKVKGNASQAVTLLDKKLCLIFASPQNHSKRGLMEILLPDLPSISQRSHGHGTKSAPSTEVPGLHHQ
jgi:hypothetical protein